MVKSACAPIEIVREKKMPLAGRAAFLLVKKRGGDADKNPTLNETSGRPLVKLSEVYNSAPGLPKMRVASPLFSSTSRISFPMLPSMLCKAQDDESSFWQDALTKSNENGRCDENRKPQDK